MNDRPPTLVEAMADIRRVLGGFVRDAENEVLEPLNLPAACSRAVWWYFTTLGLAVTTALLIAGATALAR